MTLGVGVFDGVLLNVGKQSEAPVLLNVPTAQLKHTLTEAPPMLGLYLPAVQLTHAEGRLAYVPAGHAVEVYAQLAAPAVLYLPAKQSKHDPAPARLYVPCANKEGWYKVVVGEN